MKLKHDRRHEEANRRFDGTLYSHSRVTKAQSWGLIILGTNLTAGGIIALAFIVSRAAIARGALDRIALIITVLIFGAIVAFGLLILKRAYSGRH